MAPVPDPHGGLADPRQRAIIVAPTGARRTKADHPAVPITPGDVAKTAAACREAGASAIHLHVRDGSDRHILDVAAYRAMTSAVKAEAGADFVCQTTTEAVGRYSPDQQMALVDELRPEACSIALREIFAEDAPIGRVAEFLSRHCGAGMGIQIILYDDADVRHLVALKHRGVIPDRLRAALFVLGRYADPTPSEPRAILPFLNDFPSDMTFTVCAFGPRETACALTAAGLGGHSRVGFENNLSLPSGDRAPDNAALVRSVADSLPAMGLSPAGPDAARRILGCG